MGSGIDRLDRLLNNPATVAQPVRPAAPTQPATPQLSGVDRLDQLVGRYDRATPAPAVTPATVNTVTPTPAKTPSLAEATNLQETRDALERQYNDALAANGGQPSTQSDALMKQMLNLDKWLDQQHSNGGYDDNIANMFRGAGEGLAQGYVGAARVFREGQGHMLAGQQQNVAAYLDAVGSPGAEFMRQQANQTLSDFYDERERLIATSDRLADQSAQHIEQAKEGLGTVGRVLVDAGVAGTQMLGDAVGNLIMPGGSLALMGIRSFGSASEDARRKGADFGRQFAYALPVAATEVLTEKMFDGLAGIFGKGAADNYVEALISKLAKTQAGQNALRALANMGGEAMEEAVSGLVDPMLQNIIDDRQGEGVFRNYTPEAFADLGYSALIGGILGGLGGSVDIMKNPDLSAKIAAEQAAENPTPAQTQNVTAQAQGASQATPNTTPAENAVQRDVGASNATQPTDTLAQVIMDIQRSGAEKATKAQVEAVMNDAASMQRLGVEPATAENGKTASQVRGEVKDALAQAIVESQQTPASNLNTNAPQNAEAVNNPVTEQGQNAAPVNTNAEQGAGVTASATPAAQANQNGGTVNEQSRSSRQAWSYNLDGQQASVQLSEQSNTESARVRRANYADLIQNAERTTAAGAGIADGADAELRVLNEDAARKASPRLAALYDDASKNGVKLHLTSGAITTYAKDANGNYITDKKGNRVTERSYACISDDGSDAWVSVDSYDDPLVLLKHEEHHKMLDTQPGLREKELGELYSRYGKDGMKELIKTYLEEYGGADISDEDLITEILCDAFAGNEIRPGEAGATAYSDVVRETAMKPNNDNSNIRGPTAEAAQTTEAKAPAEPAPAKEVPTREVVEKTGTRKSLVTLTKSMGMDIEQDADGRLFFTVDGKMVDHVTPDHIKNSSGIGALIKTAQANGFLSQREANKQYKAAAKLMEMVINTQSPGDVWAYAGATLFSAMKSNADPQYSTTIDFTTVCRKTQNMITAMSTAMKKLGRGLTKSEVTDLQARLIQDGSQVPCPVCYVFSRWAGIGAILDDINRYQNKYSEENYDAEKLKRRYNELSERVEKWRADHPTEKGKPSAESKGVKAIIQELQEQYDTDSYTLEARNAKQSTTDTRPDSEIREELDELRADIDLLGEYVFVQLRLDPDYKAVPPEILFDLDSGKDFASDYSVMWKYRTTRGPAAGKAIVPYSDMRLGDIILGVKENSSTGDMTFETVKGDMTPDQQKKINSALARVAAQNLLGGQRFQSTSDFRYEYALDYLQAFWELQALGSNMQTYTKIVEFVDLVAAVGGDVNCSVMPKGKGYEGNRLLFSKETGMNIEAAKKANSMYDSAQLILVGINDKHIRLALEDDADISPDGQYIGMVIPYHASGASITEFISELVKHLGEDFVKTNYKDYSPLQNDIARADATAEQKANAEIRKQIVTGNGISEEELSSIKAKAEEQKSIVGRSFEELRAIEEKALAGDKAAIREYSSWTAGALYNLYNRFNSEDAKKVGLKLSSTQSDMVMPYEYWDKTTTRKNAYINGLLFRSYCYNLGLCPRFTGFKKGKGGALIRLNYGDFSDCPGYWKTLIDRAMYTNKGVYRDQNRINVTEFDNGMLTPEYAEKNWAEYKVPEPNAKLATKTGDAFADAILQGPTAKATTAKEADAITKAIRKREKAAAKRAAAKGTKKSRTGGTKDALLSALTSGSETTRGDVNVQENFDAAHVLEYNEARGKRRPAYQNVIDRLNGDGEAPTIDEIMELPEIQQTERENEGTPTFERPGREQIRAVALEKAQKIGSYNEKTGELDGPVRQEHRMDIVMGLPGSGKSSVYTNQLSSEHGSRVIDTDEYRAFIPEYNGRNAALVHEEASQIKDDIFDKAIIDGDNILLSTIGDNAEKLAKKIEGYKKAGYSVYLHLNELPNRKAMARALGRYIKSNGQTDRYVSPELIYSYGDKPTQAYYTLTGQEGTNHGSGLGRDLRESGRPLYGGTGENTGETGGTPQGAGVRDLLAGWDHYSNDVGFGEGPVWIDGSEGRPVKQARASATKDALLAALTAESVTPGPKNISRLSENEATKYTPERAKAAGVTRKQYEDMFKYRVRSERESTSRAKDIVYDTSTGENVFLKDADPGAYNNLLTVLREAPAWNDVMVDTANLISKELETRSRNSEIPTAEYRQWLDNIREHATNTGRGTQAWAKWARLMRNVSTDGRLYMMQRALERIAKELGRDVDMSISEELKDAYLNAANEEARDAVVEQIQKEAVAKLPASALEKWNALRYVNMLGNVKTQIRNVAGNVGMQALTKAKDKVAASIEGIASVLSGGKLERTKVLHANRALVKAATDYYNDSTNGIASAALGDSKYVEGRAKATDAFEKTILDLRAKNTFGKANPLRYYQRATNWAMEAGDVIFNRPAFTHALAGWLQAHKVTADQFSNENWRESHADLVDRATNYAIKEAQESTFRDSNALSSWVSGIARGKNTPKAIKAAAEGVLPFRKTPANVFMRAYEYSPLGLIDTAVKAAGVKSGKATGADVVNSLAKALTGTALFGLGMWLKSLGLLRGGDDDDEAQEGFESMQGHQNYALEIPDKITVAGHEIEVPKALQNASYTLDWITPSAMPLFMGSEFYKLMKDKGLEVKDVERALTSLADPMIQMSMLQGVENTISDLKYGENSSFLQLGVSLALSYLTQGLTNTLLGQAERTFEKSRKTTYTDQNSPLPNYVQRAIGKGSAKIPGVDYGQIDYIDEWGRTQDNPDTLTNAILQFLSPGYLSRINTTDVDKELQRLADNTDIGTGIFPDRPGKYITVNGENVYLTAQQYESYARDAGQTKLEVVRALINSNAYKTMSDEDKAYAIGRAYDYANQVAKSHTLEDYSPDKWVINTEKAANDPRVNLNPAYVMSYKALLSQYKDDGMNTSSANAAARQVLMNDRNLTARQKEALDEIVFSDGIYLPKDIEVDYTDKESFTISQLTDSAQRHWPTVKAQFNIPYQDYAKIWSIRQNDDYTADEKRQMFTGMGYDGYALYKALGAKVS